MQDGRTPEGLLERLQVDVGAAETTLASAGFDFAFPLRPYQRRAIEADRGRLSVTGSNRACWWRMATSTGKTKLAIALLYRLLAAKRFRRICFVVDRNALGIRT